MKSALIRILLDCVIIFSAFILPWWLTFLILIGLSFVWKFYVEFFLIGGILYMLFYRATGGNFILPFAVLIIVFAGIEFIKSRLIFYRYE
jgi:hypothetical protein